MVFLLTAGIRIISLRFGQKLPSLHDLQKDNDHQVSNYYLRRTKLGPKKERVRPGVSRGARRRRWGHPAGAHIIVPFPDMVWGSKGSEECSE